MKLLNSRLSALFLFLTIFQFHAFAQEIEISGKVTAAEDGSGLPGVTILIIGTAQGTQSDINGNYKLKATTGANLEFRFLGYTSERRTVNGSDPINIVLKEEVKALKEAVVIGYGSVRKKDLTGAVTSISSKDFQTGVVTTADQLIAGKAAGVQITPNGGGPGSGSTIRIRGGASLSASNDPLIVIDGVPVQGGIAGSPNALSLINPNDIENITILKDAASAAIYGSRGSNGVILVTTKRGTKGGQPTLSFSSQNSIGVIPRYVDVLSASELRRVVNDSGTAVQRALITDSTTSTDWQKQIYQLARTFDQNLSYGGSFKNVPFRVSVGYLNQTGILKTDEMNRVTTAINLSPTFLDGSLKVQLNLKGSYSSSFFANGGAIGSAVGFDPTKPVYTKETSRLIEGKDYGYYEYLDADGRPLSLSPKNPVAMLNQSSNRSNVYRSISNVTIDYTPKFFPDISANLNLGYDISKGTGNSFTTDSSAVAYEQKGASNQYKQENRNLLGEFYLKYNKEIPKLKSKIEVLAGTSFQDFYTIDTYYRGLTYKGDTILGSKPLQFPFDKPQNRIQSFYGRLIYSLNNKYLLSATVRQDGSSKFGRENRWGLFPTLAVAWTVSEENFLKNQKLLSTLKFRLSYGETGQQDGLQNYGYLPRFSAGAPTVQYPFGNNYYQSFAPIAFDPNIKWETSTTYNAAIDFGLFDERISGSVDFYMKKTSDLLNTISLPSGSNFSDQVQTNVGSVENKGVELSINSTPILTPNLIWNLGFNITYNKNTITKLIAVEDSNYVGLATGGIGLDRNIQLHRVGNTFQAFYVLEQVYDSNGKPIEGQFIDQNNDGRINEKDFVIKHQPAPKFLFGLSTSVTWKKLTIGMVVRANYGNYVYAGQWAGSGAYSSILTANPFLSNGSGNLLETNFDGNIADSPKNTYRFFSSYYLRNAAFIKFDNINVSYNFGEVYKKLRLAANFNLQNAFIISKYAGINPELSNGIDNSIYPIPRVFTLGLSLTY